ncbi:MAG: aminoacyl-tRNA deacylase [Oscillospiraceae bacterium]
MAKSSIEKTNVMRLLDQKKVPYTPHTYPHGDDAVDGVTVAQMTGMDPAKVFKTLVARGASKTPYVFVIPVACELDLQKAAKAVGRSPSPCCTFRAYASDGLCARRLLAGRHEKQFRTVFASQALAQETILVSAGKIGYQVETAPQALIALVRATTADLTIEES